MVRIPTMPARFSAVVIALAAASSFAECPSLADVEAARARARSTARVDDQQKAESLESVRLECLSEERDTVALQNEAGERRRLAEEEAAKKAAVAKAEKEFADVVAELVTRPDVLRVLASIKLCDERAEDRRVMGEIQQEKANSKIAGVISPYVLKELQDEVVFSRKLQENYKKWFSELKTTPLGCTHKTVQRLVQCRDARVGCVPDMAYMLAALEMVDLRNQE